MPSITELVCELGLADQLVGRTGFCVHPAQAVHRVPKVGGTKAVNLRRIRELAPTHVIVNVDENRKETADALAAFVPNVIVTHPLAPLDNLALYRQLGRAFDREDEAERLCAGFAAAHAAASANVFPRRRVLYLIWKAPWMTVSRDTYVSRTLSLFGAETLPAATEARYPKLPDLRVEGVEAILLSTEPYRFLETHARQLREETGLPVHLIDGEMTSWYGPRAIRGLAYLASFFDPSRSIT